MIQLVLQFVFLTSFVDGLGPKICFVIAASYTERIPMIKFVQWPVLLRDIVVIGNSAFQSLCDMSSAVSDFARVAVSLEVRILRRTKFAWCVLRIRKRAELRVTGEIPKRD